MNVDNLLVLHNDRLSKTSIIFFNYFLVFSEWIWVFSFHFPIFLFQNHHSAKLNLLSSDILLVIRLGSVIAQVITD